MNVAPINTTSNNPNFTASAKSIKGLYKNARAAYKKNYSKYVDEPLKEKVLGPILDTTLCHGVADKISTFSEKTQKYIPLHMSTAGSVVTTYFYANQTKKKFKNDEEQKKRAKTLMLNQWGVTGVSAGITYLLNDKMQNLAKGLERKFRELNQHAPNGDARSRVISTVIQLATFTTTFRYIAPVFVTPTASKGSKWIEKYRNDKQAAIAKQEELKNQPIVTNPFQNTPTQPAKARA